MRFVNSASVLFVVAVGASCGRPTNQNIPQTPDQLAALGGTGPTQNLWVKLAARLLIDTNNAKTEAQLKTQLGVPSELIGNPEFLQTKLIPYQIKNSARTRCASVASLQKIYDKAFYNDALGNKIEIDGTSVYVMKYVAHTGATPLEANRAALLVLPEVSAGNANAGSLPLVVYGHGGDSGLKYKEIGKVFGAKQAQQITIAPAFPGEGICKGESALFTCNADGVFAAALGESSPYDSDSEDMLVAQDCLVRVGASQALASAAPFLANYPIATFPEISAEGAAIQDRKIQVVTLLKRMAGGFFQTFGVPVSYISGSSRGGGTATIALAKSGAALAVWGTHFTAKSAGNAAGEVLGSDYVFPSLFSCAVTNFAPTTLVHAQFRVLLELMVRGVFKDHRAWFLPSARQIDNSFEKYRNGTVDAATMALEVASKDTSLNAPLVVSAVQNWSKFQLSGGVVTAAGPGAILMKHGLMDRVVPVEQSLFTSRVLKATSAGLVAAAKGPGVTLSAVGIAVPPANLNSDGTLVNGQFDHGDDSYTNGQAAVDLTAANPANPASAFAGQTPFALESQWLQGDCAAASVP